MVRAFIHTTFLGINADDYPWSAIVHWQAAFSTTTRKLLDDDSKTYESNIPVYVDLLKQRGHELEEELLAIRARQNGYAHPNRLPRELLEKIFMELALDVYWDWEDDNRLRWVRVAHVCRHWRAVALDYAPLWSTLVVAHPEFLKLMLARSKGAPLSFTLNTERLVNLKYRRASIIRGGLVEALSQTERYHSLEVLICRRGGASLQDLLSKASGPAPYLRELKLCNVKTPSTSIPDDFLQGGAPLLQRLELQHIHVPWSQLPLPATLTHLNLCKGGPRPPLAEFYESLSKLDALKHLTLVKWLPKSGYSDIPAPTQSPLILNSLRFIEVEDSANKLSDFFKVIRIPHVIKTRLTIDNRRPEGPVIDACLEKVRNAINDAIQRYPEPVQFHIQDLDTDEEEEDPVFQLWYPPLPDESDDGEGLDGDGYPSIVIQFGKRSLPLPEVLASIGKHFGLAAVTALDLMRCPGMSPTTLLKAFSSLPNLSHLALTATPIYEIFEALEADSSLTPKEQDGSAPQPMPYFPALSSIALTSIDFDEDGGAEDTMELIIGAINKRPKSHSIEDLHLETCRNFGAADFQTLRNRVRSTTNVTWDEDEDWSDDEESYSGSEESGGS